MNSKYFSAPLQEDERHTVAALLGLFNWQFALVEVYRNEILRTTQAQHGSVQYVLAPSEGLTPLKVDHSRSNDANLGMKLWKEIVPHPFFLLPDVEDSSPLELTCLWNALSELEEALVACEVSVVRILSGDRHLNLVFHYVRSRCVRIGTTVWPREFGTSHQVFELNISTPSSPKNLAQLIENAVKSRLKAHSIPGLSLGDGGEIVLS